MALTDLPGIGPALADKLRVQGIASEQGLARASPERVASITGRSIEQATGWIAAAQDVVAIEGGDHSESGDLQPGDRRPADGLRIVGDIFLGLNLGYLALTLLLSILAFAFIAATSSSAGTVAPPGGMDQAAFTRLLLWLTNIHNLVVFGAIPLAWVAMTRVGGWEGMKRFLGLTGTWMSNLGWGTLAGVILVVIFGGIALLLEALGIGPTDAPIEDAVAHITWPLVIVTSLVAGFAEEILFRGVLQRWMKWWGQAIAFGLLHIGNAGILSVVVTAMIALMFGYARHRGVSLWKLMIAHTVYDLILLSSVILAPDLATGEGSGWIRW